MASSLQDRLIDAVSTESQETLLPRMGYPAQDDRAWARLNALLASPWLGLDTSDYDFRYNAADFLRMLGRALQIDPWVVDLEIHRIQHQLRVEKEAFQPYLWLDTQFKRENQPIFALAACESHRHLFFPKQTALLPFGEQIAAAKARIIAHQQETSGDAGIWGQVHQYLYYYAKGKALVFSTEGEMVGERSSDVPDKATLMLNGRSLFSSQ